MAATTKTFAKALAVDHSNVVAHIAAGDEHAAAQAAGRLFHDLLGDAGT